MDPKGSKLEKKKKIGLIWSKLVQIFTKIGYTFFLHVINRVKSDQYVKWVNIWFYDSKLVQNGNTWFKVGHIGSK